MFFSCNPGRGAYLLHVAGRNSVGGVSVEGWSRPIYQVDLRSLQRPSGGPTLPDRRAKTDGLRSGGGIWAEDHLNCHSIAGPRCQLCSFAFLCFLCPCHLKDGVVLFKAYMPNMLVECFISVKFNISGTRDQACVSPGAPPYPKFLADF